MAKSFCRLLVSSHEFVTTQICKNLMLFAKIEFINFEFIDYANKQGGIWSINGPMATRSAINIQYFVAKLFSSKISMYNFIRDLAQSVHSNSAVSSMFAPCANNHNSAVYNAYADTSIQSLVNWISRAPACYSVFIYLNDPYSA